jgi:ABC-type dipeptide/oligopeptide/nickel transport system permease subunit
VALSTNLERSDATPLNDWRLRLALLRRRLAGFGRQLRQQPATLLGALILIIYLAAMVAAPAITWHDPATSDLRQRFLPPAWLAGGNWSYPMGTDAQGRDLYARIIYGAWASLGVGFLAVGISVVIGAGLGAVSGYFQGWLDRLLSRFAELLLAFPYLLFAIGVMAFLGPGFRNLILALTFKGWVEFFRLARGEILAEKRQEYVEAARVVGQRDWRIIRRELLPNILHSIMMEASLSFLGLGIQPPTPAWGSMVATGRDYLLNAWWVSTLPGLSILVVVLAINLLGEGLREIFDPRWKMEE